jgi:hypothetical protein
MNPETEPRTLGALEPTPARPTVFLNSNVEHAERMLSYRFGHGADWDELWPGLCRELALTLSTMGIRVVAQRAYSHWAGGPGSRMIELAFPLYVAPDAGYRAMKGPGGPVTLDRGPPQLVGAQAVGWESEALAPSTPALTRQMAPEMEVYRQVRTAVFRIESGLSQGIRSKLVHV